MKAVQYNEYVGTTYHKTGLPSERNLHTSNALVTTEKSF